MAMHPTAKSKEFINTCSAQDGRGHRKAYGACQNYPGYKELWNEGSDGPHVDFHPTFKIKTKNSTEYENVKNECPSYCDRILLKQNSPDEIISTDYRSLPVHGSNHLPVALNFSIKDFFAVNTAYLDAITMTSCIPSATITIEKLAIELNIEALGILDLIDSV